MDIPVNWCVWAHVENWMPMNRKTPKNVCPEPASNLSISLWPLSYSQWSWWATQLWRLRGTVGNDLCPLGLGARGQSPADLTHNRKHSLWLGCPAPVLAGVTKDTSSSVRVSSTGFIGSPDRPPALSRWAKARLQTLLASIRILFQSTFAQTRNWLSFLSIQMSSSFFKLLHYVIGIGG